MSKIELYTYPTSPYGLKVHFYLKYKQLDYTFVPVNPITNQQIRFTRQRQVPVLNVDGEWRKESSELGIWLDELYGQKPLLGKNEEERNRILEIDKWVSDSLIPSVFRHAYEWESRRQGISNGRRLAKVVNKATPIPLLVRYLWPYIIKRAGFIVRMMRMVDLNEPIPDMRQRLDREFLQHLGKGPFLGELPDPSLADLSAYPVMMFQDLIGLEKAPVPENPAITEWKNAVKKRLPEKGVSALDGILKGQ